MYLCLLFVYYFLLILVDKISHDLKSVGTTGLDLEIRLLVPSAEEEMPCLNPKRTKAFYDHVTNPYLKLHGFLRYIINR